jgi:hypothetical protein
MATKQSFKPQNARALLSTALVLVIIGGAALFYFGLGLIKDYSQEVNTRMAEADASQQRSEQMRVLAQQVTQNESLLAKADKLFVGADTYQSQALTDVRNYAAQAGMTLAGTDFQDTSSGTYSMSVRFTNPVSYTGLIQFLLLVESSVPKMQTTAIELARTPEANTVEVKNITITISVR